MVQYGIIYKPLGQDKLVFLVYVLHNTDYVVTAVLNGGFFIKAKPSISEAILLAAYFPYADGVHCR